MYIFCLTRRNKRALFGEVKSRLLPISRLEKFLEGLIECLPRKQVGVALIPAGDSERTEEDDKNRTSLNWVALNLELSPQQSRGGWFYFETILTQAGGNREAFLQIKTDGNEDVVVVPTPANMRGAVREVIFIPRNANSFAWHHRRSSTNDSPAPILLHKISMLESCFRRIYRVSNDILRLRHRTRPLELGQLLLFSIRNLQEAYIQSAQSRMNHMRKIDYNFLLKRIEISGRAHIKIVEKQIAKFPDKPLFSIIVHARNPNVTLLRRLLDSMLYQRYSNWEVLLAGNTFADTGLANIANEYEKKDARIRTWHIPLDHVASQALNDLICHARGEWIARISQHDCLPPESFLYFAHEACFFPNAEIIYSDNDCIEISGQRKDPRFKPDWNPDLFLSHDYIDNLRVFRRRRIVEIGGYRNEFEEAEDFDLTLRYIKRLPQTAIRHIPRILHHTHLDVGNKAANAARLSTAHRSGKSALESATRDSQITIEDGPSLCLYRTIHPLPALPPMVSMIIPTRDKAKLLKACVESIRIKTLYKNWEMLIVDNLSVEPDAHQYLDEIDKDHRITVLRYEKEFNYSAINNFAVSHAKGEVLALLNNDVEVISPEWLTEMVSHAIRPEIGAVGAKLLYPDWKIQHAGVIIGLGGVAGHAHKLLCDTDHGYCHRAVLTQNLSAVTGACLVVRKHLYESVGGLDEKNLIVAFNDTNFCLELRELGYRNLYTPYSKLFHHESVSRGRDDTPEKHVRFSHEYNYMKKIWGDKLRFDPAYNINLPEEQENFSFSTNRAPTEHT